MLGFGREGCNLVFCFFLMMQKEGDDAEGTKGMRKEEEDAEGSPN